MGREHLDPAPRVASAGGWFAGLLRRLVVFLSFAGAGVVVVGLFPRRVGRVAERIAEGPATALAIGTLTATALVVGALVFALTIIGLPVTFLLVALLGLAWLMGFVGICQALGDRLPFEQKVHGRWLAFLAGTLLVAFVGSLPFVGVAGLVIASALGIGASVATRLGAV
jgi:hypothetical protein